MGKRKKGRMLLAAFSALLLTLGAAGMADTQYVEGKTQAKQIDVMFTHDTHSHLNSFTTLVDGEEAEVGGFARIKTLIDAQKEKNPDTLILDGGDFSMGTLVLHSAELSGLRCVSERTLCRA